MSGGQDVLRKSGETAMIQKQCVICKQMYVPALPNRQKTCSSECRKAYSRILNNSEKQRSSHKEWYNKTHPLFCKLCGKPIQRVDKLRPQRMHDECIYEDCKKTLAFGKRLSDLQRNRLVSRGFSITEFKEAVKEGFV